MSEINRLKDQALIQTLHFMQVAGQETPSYPTIPNETVCELRYNLIAEELEEFKEGIYKKNLV